ncbi:MAG: Rieske 2Fe-2S domain-containing protein [Zavarzinella sp.]|nr:Rieske 2Fe-2S domain-containing protein [Zavarzinella sp.]
MRSKAHIKGHPLHPILIAFPIAFGVGCLVFDVVGRLGNWSTVWAAGAYMSAAAVITGLAAAVPAFIDYRGIVPPNSSAKDRAVYHMLVNVTSLLLIAIGWQFRDADTLRPGAGTIVLQALAVGLMGAGGWMGGTLVYRNQIGVDHRYAHAGKWKEGHVDGKPGEAVAVATTGELKVGQMKLVHVGDRRIVLARTETGHVACDDRCTHRGGPLSDGVLADGTIACPWHGSQFDAETGEVKAGPATAKIGTYTVDETTDQVKLVIPDDRK